MPPNNKCIHTAIFDSYHDVTLRHRKVKNNFASQMDPSYVKHTDLTRLWETESVDITFFLLSSISHGQDLRVTLYKPSGDVNPDTKIWVTN